MLIKLFLVSAFLMLMPVAMRAQSAFATCAEQNLVSGRAEALDSLTNYMVTALKSADFYLVGEAHTFLANNDLQFSLIKSLHKFGVYNVANELPHSTCFIFNQYLESGDESLLTNLKPAATYAILKKVRTFNLGQPENQRIRYFGIDYIDVRHDQSNFPLSLTLIREKIPSNGLPLDFFLDRYIQKAVFTQQDIVAVTDTLFNQLQADSATYKKHFQEYYDDLLLMASNMVKNRTNRDSDIFKSFSLLYQRLAAKETHPPKFLAFYGIGHLENFGDILLSNANSPVKGSVCKIALQYVNCLGGWTTAAYRNDGLFKIPKKKFNEVIAYSREQPWKVAVFTSTDCFMFKKQDRPDAVIVFNSYGDRKMNSWKFD